MRTCGIHLYNFSTTFSYDLDGDECSGHPGHQYRSFEGMVVLVISFVLLIERHRIKSMRSKQGLAKMMPNEWILVCIHFSHYLNSLYIIEYGHIQIFKNPAISTTFPTDAI